MLIQSISEAVKYQMQFIPDLFPTLSLKPQTKSKPNHNVVGKGSSDFHSYFLHRGFLLFDFVVTKCKAAILHFSEYFVSLSLEGLR